MLNHNFHKDIRDYMDLQEDMQVSETLDMDILDIDNIHIDDSAEDLNE